MYKQAIPQYKPTFKSDALVTVDAWLLATITLLIGLGLIMVASSSTAIADRHFDQPLYYFWRQLYAVAFGTIAILYCLQQPLSRLHSVIIPFMITVLLLLILVLIPGIGKEVNGSSRWLMIGTMSLQPSEIIKVLFIVYLASHIAKYRERRDSAAMFIQPILLLLIITFLLLLEPDYGSCVVLFFTALGMLFMGGIPLARFCALSLTALAFLAYFVISEPYRIQRLMSFTDPWKDPYSSGFQLTQALIAFGRGDWFGVGLGNSVQKLFYLPEAHTDFLFSVFAEEFGFFGTSLLILLFGFLIWQAFLIGHNAEKIGKFFGAYIAYGIGLIISVQAFINIGVNLGVLPTKGLPLPLISYGNNNMIVTCLLLGMLFRVDIENRQIKKLSN